MAGAFGLTVTFNRIPAVQSAMRAAALSSLTAQAKILRDTIRTYEHVVTGYMRAHTEVTTAVNSGDMATIAVLSSAPYSAAEELGTAYRPGHHRIETGAAAGKPAFVAGVAHDLGAAVESAAKG